MSRKKKTSRNKTYKEILISFFDFICYNLCGDYMKEKLNGILFFSIIFMLVDQIIKFFITDKMVINQSITLIRDFFFITYTHNTGAAFSIFSGNTYLLILIAIITVIGLGYYVIKLESIDDIDVFIYSLLFGGIIGNLIDRIINGYVIDYLSFKFGTYYFPIFNFADMCIVVSVILILIRMIKEDIWK